MTTAITVTFNSRAMTSSLDFIDVPRPLHLVLRRWNAFSRSLGDLVPEAYFIPASGRCFVALLPGKQETHPPSLDRAHGCCIDAETKLYRCLPGIWNRQPAIT